MRFRLKAFRLHLLGSAIALGLIFGILYFGWYRWPGWYLADVSRVILVMAAVDLVVGPLFTLIVANANKAKRVLARDITIIVAIQLCALTYGAALVWKGRPLYYAFSENVLQLVQAYDIEPAEWALAAQRNAELAPHWYSLPRWIWAPLPEDPDQRQKILASAVTGGDDVISMPRYFKLWEQGLPELRKQLRKVDDVGYFSNIDKKALKIRMRAAGLPPDQANAIPLTGRGYPLLAVFDTNNLKITALLKAK